MDNVASMIQHASEGLTEIIVSMEKDEVGYESLVKVVEAKQCLIEALKIFIEKDY